MKLDRGSPTIQATFAWLLATAVVRPAQVEGVRAAARQLRSGGRLRIASALPTKRLLLSDLKERAAGRAASGTSAGSRFGDDLPALTVSQKSQACEILCNQVNTSPYQVRACINDCVGKLTTQTADSAWCAPVADVNVIGLPGFQEFDLRHDMKLDWEEWEVYTNLLCIPEQMLMELFYSLDEDGDLLVSAEEWNAAAGEPEEEHSTSTTTTVVDAQHVQEQLMEFGMQPWSHLEGKIGPPGHQRIEYTALANSMMKEAVYMFPKLGPKIRQELWYDINQLPPLIDTSGDGLISDEEYSSAQRVWELFIEAEKDK